MHSIESRRKDWNEDSKTREGVRPAVFKYLGIYNTVSTCVPYDDSWNGIYAHLYIVYMLGIWIQDCSENTSLHTLYICLVWVLSGVYFAAIIGSANLLLMAIVRGTISSWKRSWDVIARDLKKEVTEDVRHNMVR